MKLLDRLLSVFKPKPETYRGFTREQLLEYLPEKQQKYQRLHPEYPMCYLWQDALRAAARGIEAPPDCIRSPFSPCGKFYANVARAQETLAPMPRAWESIYQYDDLIVVHRIVVARTLQAAREEMRKCP